MLTISYSLLQQLFKSKETNQDAIYMKRKNFNPKFTHKEMNIHSKYFDSVISYLIIPLIIIS